MTQEDKEILLKDLSARIPYDIKCKIETRKYCNVCTIFSINSLGYIEIVEDSDTNGVNIERIKPYLFPLSSMTEEQMFDFAIVRVDNLKGTYPTLSECSAIIDWGYKHHFDVNGLIEKGLAIDATGKNIY